MTSTSDPAHAEGDALSWIEPARHGDAAAMERALEPFRPYLMMIASRALEPALATRIDPSDLVQETFLAANLGLAGFQGSTEGQWRAWLKAILMNRLANLRRSLRGARKSGFDWPTPDEDLAALAARIPGAFTPPPRRLQIDERDRAIRAALRRLPEHYRNVVVWHHDDGLTFEEIGSRLGVSADAARKKWNRALMQLQAILGPTHDPR